MLQNAQDNFDFFETPKHHSEYIYNDCNPQQLLKVVDICCGLGSLVQPWYDNGHEITLIELNDDFIPHLKKQFPKATILQKDFFDIYKFDDFDVYLCNPPFNTTHIKKIYVDFFCKILHLMRFPAILYYICPKMFYKNQIDIKIELPMPTQKWDLKHHIEQYRAMPASFYFDRYKMIELHSNGFRFDKAKIKRMVKKHIIEDDFIDDENFIVPYFEFRYLGNIFDFTKTNCKCGIFKVNC